MIENNLEEIKKCILNNKNFYNEYINNMILEHYSKNIIDSKPLPDDIQKVLNDNMLELLM